MSASERYQDPADSFNSEAYHTGKPCVERGCDAPAGTHWSPLWCFRHNVERMDRINLQLEPVRKALGLCPMTTEPERTLGEGPPRDELAQRGYETQAAFLRRHGLGDTVTFEWASLAHDDLAREEWREIINALMDVFAPHLAALTERVRELEDERTAEQSMTEDFRAQLATAERETANLHIQLRAASTRRAEAERGRDEARAALRQFGKHLPFCNGGCDIPKCLDCDQLLDRPQRPDYLNGDQWNAVKAGDYYCRACRGTRAENGYRYFWSSELPKAPCDCGLDAILPPQEARDGG